MPVEAITPASDAGWDDRRLSFVVFCGAVVAAGVYWLHVGRNEWFLTDEWAFLAQPALTAHYLLAPYNSHWSTLPLLLYRLMFDLVGLRSYVPYLSVTVGLHLATATLLRLIMRRIGVNPWIATVAASLFLFFGAGAQNILWSVQMCFLGSLVFGLLHLLLADHDGPADRRDLVGLAAGLAALMCSGVGVTMAIIVGVAVFMRRGWRAAALHVVPLAAIFGSWWIVCRDWGTYNLGEGSASLTATTKFVGTGVGATFGAVGQLPGAAWALGAILILGLLLAWRQTRPDERARRFAVPAALFSGMLAFLVTSGIGRAHEGAEHARQGRYLYITVALLVPVLALAVDAFAQRRRILLPLAVAVFVVGVPGNLAATGEYTRLRRPDAILREGIVAVARAPLSRHVPRSTPIQLPRLPKTVTYGWILDAEDSGRLPGPRDEQAPTHPEPGTG